MPRLVFEIGTEEIPPRFLPGAVDQLKALAQERLGAQRLDFEKVQTYATPRRLALIVEGLAKHQEPRMRSEQGPPASKGFDENGAPSQAAVGFANRWGLKPEALQVKPTPRGDYLFAEFKEEGRPASDVLKELLPALAGALYFPKTMRWGTGSLRFGRPVRWLVALLDKRVIKFELDGLAAGRESRGHPILSPRAIKVEAAQAYEKALRRAKVMLDQKERECTLLGQIKEIAKTEKARLCEADDLILETVYSVEWPTAICGKFDKRYLKLPRPVLTEEMRKVQYFFPLEGARGKLIARFIGVRDGGTTGLDIVRAGYEGVLRAKFEDATFFYEHDRRKTLESRLEELKGVVFLEGMGSLYDKSQRIEALAGWLADQLGLDQDVKATAARAARLAKADLVCDLVVEITSLQGTMGQEYALADGEPEAVAQAIGEHYRPRSVEDKLPATPAGRIVALADKLDTVIAGLAAGLNVSGSEDPFGLRRDAQAVVTLILESDFALSISQALEQAWSILATQQSPKKSAEDTKRAARALLRGRLERLLEDAPPLGKGIRYDLADAVLAAADDDFFDAARRAQALQKLYNHKDFMPTIVASTRPANIVKGFSGGEPEAALFEMAAEKELWAACRKAKPKIEERTQAGDYEGLFAILSELRPAIDKFFDEVLVMAEDEKVRQNRLALVWQVDRLFKGLADFRLVVQEGNAKK